MTLCSELSRSRHVFMLEIKSLLETLKEALIFQSDLEAGWLRVLSWDLDSLELVHDNMFSSSPKQLHNEININDKFRCATEP